MGADPVCGSEPSLDPGSTVGGRLTDSDESFAGARIDYFTLEISDPVTLTISESSAQLDPLLFLFDADLEVLAQAFDSMGVGVGQRETASVTYTFTPGCHVVGASSWDDGGRGAYTLYVSPPQ